MDRSMMSPSHSSCCSLKMLDWVMLLRFAGMAHGPGCAFAAGGVCGAAAATQDRRMRNVTVRRKESECFMSSFHKEDCAGNGSTFEFTRNDCADQALPFFP